MRTKDQRCRRCGGRGVIKSKAGKVPCPKCGGRGKGYPTK